jgi:hypothetical protein
MDNHLSDKVKVQMIGVSAFLQQLKTYRNTVQKRHDIQHNDTKNKQVICDIQHNDILHNDILHNDILHNDILQNDILHNDILRNDILHKNTLNAQCLMSNFIYCYAERHYAEHRYAECLRLGLTMTRNFKQVLQ